MSIEKDLLKVRKAFESVPFITIRETSFRSDQINLLCRSGDKTPDDRHIMGLINTLLNAESGWRSHICKKFFKRDGKTLFGWSFSFRSDSISVAADRVAKAIRFHVAQNIIPEDDAGEAMGRVPVVNRRGDQSPRPGKHRGAYPSGGGA